MNFLVDPNGNFLVDPSGNFLVVAGPTDYSLSAAPLSYAYALALTFGTVVGTYELLAAPVHYDSALAPGYANFQLDAASIPFALGILPATFAIFTPIYGNPVQGDGTVTIPAKRLGETVLVPIDFISRLAPTETILSAVCTMSVYTGVDPTPSAMLIGGASVSGSTVEQLVTGGVVGTIYEFLTKATTSLEQVLELAGYFAVVPDLQ